MATRGMVERELKLEATPGFVLPELPGEMRPERTFGRSCVGRNGATPAPRRGAPTAS
ncbi:MAG: hypothetical protein M3P41_15570 [Actinomycetota bacterium]|nr:hypothetical protein [Actinomycetota bacterium]